MEECKNAESRKASSSGNLFLEVLVNLREYLGFSSLKLFPVSPRFCSSSFYISPLIPFQEETLFS